MSNAKRRRHFTGQEKVAILRRHLVEKVPVSDLCEEHGIHPTLFYRWQKDWFEQGAVVFDAPRGRARNELKSPIGTGHAYNTRSVPRSLTVAKWCGLEITGIAGRFLGGRHSVRSLTVAARIGHTLPAESVTYPCAARTAAIG